MRATKACWPKIGPGTAEPSETQIKPMSQVARRPQVLADQETVIASSTPSP